MGILLAFLVSWGQAMTPARATPFVLKKSGQLVELDLNGDAKADVRQHYRGKFLQRQERSTHFDGHFDEQLRYYPWKSVAHPVLVRQVGARQETHYEDRARGYRVTRVELGPRHWVTTAPLQAEQVAPENCAPPAGAASVVTKLSDEVQPILGVIQDDYLAMKPHHRIHQSCLEHYGRDNFVNTYQTAMKNGIYCMQSLAEKATQHYNGAATLLSQLRAVWEQDQVSIVCHQTANYNWNNAAAWGSISSNDNLSELKIEHPFLSLNPHSPAIAGQPTEKELRYMQTTIFHEQLHNTGLLHGVGVEYAYACDACCIADVGEAEKDLSCRVCLGDYEHGVGDRTYVKDMLAWNADLNNKGARPMLARTAVFSYLAETNDTQWGGWALALSYRNSPIGGQLAYLWEQRYPSSTLSAEEADMRATANKILTRYPALNAQARSIAQAYVSYYLDHNAQQGLQQVKDAMAQVLSLKNTTGLDEDNARTSRHLIEQVRTLLNAIYYEGFPKSNESLKQEAEALLQQLSS